MNNLLGRHLLSVDKLSRDDLQYLLTIARLLSPVAKKQIGCNVLEGAVLANLFFEASTRTRISFHTAFARLGGKVVDTVGVDSSSLAKGESLADMARVVAGYADAIVMRHPEKGSVADFAKNIFVPVINAGDGTGEHPSQALLDFYTITTEFEALGKKIDGCTITLLGDLKHGRTIHSLVKLMAMFKQITFNCVAPCDLAMPCELVDYLESKNHRVCQFDNVADGFLNADIIYATRIQKERIAGIIPDGYDEQFRLNRTNFLRFAPKDAIILHPLPRDSRPEAFDLASDLDDLPQLSIFRQADNGLTMRMAIFAVILGVEKDLDKYFFSKKGFVPKRLGVYDR